MNPAADLLPTALDVAVPMFLAELLAVDDQILRRRAAHTWARNAVDPLCAQGDILQYGGGKPGEVAAVFNHLARGLAAGAMVPGGVTFAGRHWCVEHPRGIACASIADLSCRRKAAGGIAR
jgi:hypothetical protein